MRRDRSISMVFLNLFETCLFTSLDVHLGSQRELAIVITVSLRGRRDCKTTRKSFLESQGNAIKEQEKKDFPCIRSLPRETEGIIRLLKHQEWALGRAKLTTDNMVGPNVAAPSLNTVVSPFAGQMVQ